MAEAKRQIPRAMIHKRILDAATASPDASIKELARDVSGASVDLVERVLDEYGDPTEPEDPPQNSHSDPSDRQPMSDQELLPEPNELTEEQRVVLEAVRQWPEATQAELAERVGVSASTVNRRLHKIDGFEWTDRDSIARELIPSDTSTTAVASDGGPTRPADALADLESNDTDFGDVTESRGVSEPKPEFAKASTDSQAEAAGFEHRLDRLEREVQPATNTDRGTVPFGDAELAAKVIRACVSSDTVSEEEELRVIETIITTTERG